MNQIEYALSSEYIELIKLLKLLNLVESGANAKIAVEEGLVECNQEVEFRKRKKVRAADVVVFQNNTIKIS
jgi:ribosome-associated protein